MEALNEVLVDVCLAIAGIMLGVALSLSACVKEDCCAVAQANQETQVSH